MNVTTVTAIAGYVVAICAIAGSTVAVSLGKIDGQTYAGIIAGFGGFSLGVGAHAAGVSAATTTAAVKPAIPPPPTATLP
ncbi:MAG TPA: hypothetical protein VGN14_14380 [Candidatus Elarobacter sp.]